MTEPVDKNTTDEIQPECPRGPDQCPVYNEVEQLKQAVTQLQSQVITDRLTGLYNRAHFDEALTQEMERARRSGQPTTLILIDLDHFKSINDNYGHTAGDQVLQEVAKRIVNSIRRIDVACRFGGEELAIILPATRPLVAVQVAERIRREICAIPVTTAKGEIEVTASLGVDSFQPGVSETAELFFNRVDALLYKAKQQGRNRVEAARPEDLTDSAQVSSDEKEALFGPADDHPE